MRKNHNTSSVQSGHIVEYKFSYFKLLLAFIFFTFSITTAQAITRNSPEKWAIMFVDPSMKMTYELSWSNAEKFFEHYSMNFPMIQDKIWYQNQGYTVYIDYGDDETITRAIFDHRVKAIAYYGHGGGPNPKFGSRDHKGWKQYILTILQKHYSDQGYPPQEAYNLANSQSQNFGFRDVVNRSCGSLYNSSLADLFVSPGNSYYGSLAKKYYSGNPFVSACNDDNDWTISEYISQGKYSQNGTNCSPTGPAGTGFMEGDEQSGSHCMYHQNGLLSQEVPYANGQRNGMLRNYYDNGKRSSVTPYLNGEIHGTKFALWRNGKYRSVLHYTHGKKLGEYRTWYESGTPSACFEYHSTGPRTKCPGF